MPRHRYLSPSESDPAHDSLPIDTVLTIITRQSTVMQRERHSFSAEVNPEELRQEAITRWGFSPDRIQIVDRDMGIGAYNTVIEDRLGLHKWLYESLPSGESRVLMVSQEDRLFRDKWEDQHNTFIKQVATNRGWVICGSRLYNFQREFDCEQFRMACKYGRLYIEHHIKGRLLPALHRAALAGRYAGRLPPWGYIVDYERHSFSYGRYVRYEPHATLVQIDVFQRFAHMAIPSAMELARQWLREGLVFPYFGPEIDERRYRWLNQHSKQDAALGGYTMTLSKVQGILTNVAYLGWCVHRGEVSWDSERNQPRICHEPLIDPDVFWWCHDHIVPERPMWAPSRQETHTQVVSTYRPHHKRLGADDVLFLAPGQVRCAQHHTRFAAVSRRDRAFQLVCAVNNLVAQGTPRGCVSPPVASIEVPLIGVFLEQLVFDARDLRYLAELADQRQQHNQGDVNTLRRQLVEQKTLFERAKRRALQVDDDVVAADFLEEARQATQAIRTLEQRINEVQQRQDPTLQAWHAAERASQLADRILQTFRYWPRQAQAPVITMAIDDAVLGRIDRRTLGLWVRWHGGAISRAEVACTYGKFQPWTKEEDAVLQRHYHQLSWEALLAALPGRTPDAIETRASRLGLYRTHATQREHKIPIVVKAPEIVNVMVEYGFPLGKEQQPAGVVQSLRPGST